MDSSRVEYRTLTANEIKLAAGDSDGMAFNGYGAVFGNVDAYGDVIEPGAFAHTLHDAKSSGNWPAMLLQHGGMGLSAEDMMPVGLWTGMSEDGIGLQMEGKIAPTSRGKDAFILMKMEPRPAITGLSIGYRVKEFVSRTSPEEPRRRIKRVDLLEVSLVTFPANTKARITGVKAIDDIMSLADAEAYLREAAGLSRAQAVGFIARVKAAGTKQGEPAVSEDNMRELTELLGKRRHALLG